MPKFEFDEKENKYKVSTSEDARESQYISYDNINAFIKENYNIKLNKEKFEAKQGEEITPAPSCGMIWYSENYFYKYCGHGGDNVTKLNNIESYKIENGKLTINEKVGFLLSGESGTILYKDNETTEKVKKMKLNEESLDDLEECFDKNKEKFHTYKHTFKIENNNYYWESAELINE